MAQFPANIDLSSLDGSNGFALSAAGDTDGLSVASAGDVNGDGFADVIIGTPQGNPHGWRSGAGYVVFGKVSGFGANLDLSSLDGSNGFKLSGIAEGDYAGRSVASAGDVNGDGFADLFIGAPGAGDGPYDYNSGTSCVVFGKPTGFTANFDLSSLDGSNGFRLSGAPSLVYSGRSLASAGDVNGDGFADVIIGTVDASTSYVVFGKASGFASDIDLASLDGGNGFKIVGVGSHWGGQTGASAGASTAMASLTSSLALSASAVARAM